MILPRAHCEPRARFEGKQTMKTSQRIRLGLFALALVLFSGMTQAQWELDSSNSSVSFISIKNGTVGERHHFTSLVGFVSEDGNVQVAIDLDSVDTLIEIRDERLRELLFETAKFPAAKLHAKILPEVVSAAAQGGLITAEIPVTLEMHGHKQTLNVNVVVIGEGNRRMRVLSAKPILVNAADFGLTGGVAALQKIAGLQSIAGVVPVSLQLLFVPAE